MRSLVRFAPVPLAGGGRFLLLCAGLLVAAGCGGGGGTPAPEDAPMTRRPLADVLAEHAPRLMALEGVAIVYEGALENGSPCIRVGLATDTAAVRARIPAHIEGYPVVIDATGPIVPH